MMYYLKLFIAIELCQEGLSESLKPRIYLFVQEYALRERIVCHSTSEVWKRKEIIASF